MSGEAQSLWQQEVYHMIQHRVAAAEIRTKIGNRTGRLHRLFEEQGHSEASTIHRQACFTADNGSTIVALTRSRDLMVSSGLNNADASNTTHRSPDI
jgi:hypothetical protein